MGIGREPPSHQRSQLANRPQITNHSSLLANACIPFLPDAFTRYIAASAARSNSSADPTESGRVATPTDTVKCSESPSSARNWAAPTRSRIRVATATARLVELGAIPRGPIQDVGEGIRTAEFDDPFGNVFGVIQNPHFDPAAVR